MSRKQKTALINFITGGDLIWHRAQLFLANWLRIGLIFGFSWITIWFILSRVLVSEMSRTVFAKVILAKAMKLIFVPGFPLSVPVEGGGTVRMTASQLVNSAISDPTLSAEISKVIWLGSVSAIIALTIAIVAVWLNLKFGVAAQKDLFIRGQKIVKPDELVGMVDDPSPIKVAGVPIPTSVLARNFLSVGSMGTGKSQTIFPMFEQVRAWGKKAIVYDKTGEYVQKYFRPGKDFILNPVDARCADWSIFADLRKVTDPTMISKFFVPENKNVENRVFDNSARMLLEDIIQIVARKHGTMGDILRIITRYSLDDLAELLAASDAPSCGVINPKNERSSESVRLTLTAQPAFRFFRFFNKSDATFSIREFVRRDDDACLFLVSNSTQHEAIKPFISAWIEIALAEAMSMRSTQDVRLIFFLDELASLSKLGALETALTEARKYGIVSLVGIQNLAQLEEIYGREITRVLIANLQNKLMLRCEEEASAKQLADLLGKEEVEEVNESKSFGVESSRDGVNLGTKRTERHLVTPTELMTLPDLTGWLKLAGAFPIAEVTFPYVNRRDVAEGYIEIEGLDLDTYEPSPQEEMKGSQSLEQREDAVETSPAAVVTQSQNPW